MDSMKVKLNIPPMSMLQEYQSETMTIWEFLSKETPWWTNPFGNTVCLCFREIGVPGLVRYVSVGSYPPVCFDAYAEADPSKYVELDGIGGLMGELMDLSIQFNLYKVFVKRSFNNIEYTVWLNRLENGQERNIDADMVEKFSNKVFGK
jgi:hypothetical protein